MTGINAILRLDRWRRASISTLAAAALGCLAQGANAQGLRWVEASDDIPGNQYPQNLFPAANPSDPLSTALNAFGANNGNDQVNNDQGWTYRDEGAAQNTSLGLTATVYESVQENSPELLFRATSATNGITPNTAYNVYIAYWSDATSEWAVRAGATANPGANTLFNRAGGNGGTAGTFAGSAVWSLLPQDNPDVNPLNPGGPPNPDNPSPFINETNLDVMGGAVQTQRMYLGLVGTLTSNGAGQLDVYVDDSGNTTDLNQRAWFDGIAIIPATVTTPVFTTAAIDRATGNLSFTNPTGVPLNIKSYTVNSPAGSLDSTSWSEIAPTGGWAVTAPVAPDSRTQNLSEQDNVLGSVTTIAANGGVQDFGNVWVRSTIEDVTLSITLTDDSRLDIVPTFTGTALAAGDFNADGAIDVGDFGILRTNFGTAAATLAAKETVETYLLGDFSRDKLINRDDFIAFRAAYDQFNGAGSFEAMVASIPEPSTGVLAIFGLGIFRSLRRRRPVAATSSFDEKAPMIGSSKVRRLVVAALAVAVSMTSSAAWAQTIIPVAGWFARNNTTGIDVPITGAATNDPVVGDATVGSNAADNTTVWAALASPVTIINGQELVLKGRVQTVGMATTGDAFRFGMFDGFNFGMTPYDTVAHERYVTNVPMSRAQVDADSQTYGWLGFLASANSGGGNGFLEARNPARPAGQTNTQFISNAGGGDTFPLANLGTGPGQTQTPTNRVIRLNAAPSVGNFNEDTYDFSMTIGRFGFENTMSARLQSTTLLPLAGDLEPDGDVDGNDALLWQRNGAPPTTPVLNNIKSNFGQAGGGSPDYVFNISATASPSQDTVPSMITNEIDRVGFLLSGTMDTDQAIFTDVQLELRQIQSLILDVNTNTGAVSVRNASGVPFDVSYYEMTSINGNLSAGGWVSRDDGEGGDLVGVGWDELGTPTANLLAEGNLTGSQLVNNGASFSLGTAFNTATILGQRDTNFFFATTDGQLHRGVVNYNTTSTVGAVPEPASMGLALAGLIGLAGRRRRA